MQRKGLKMNEKIIAYSSYFISYLLDELKDLSKIREIILFGSVARRDATKESDVDIFIRTMKNDRNLERQIGDSIEKFYKTREALLFKSKGIDNKINIIIGKLEEWPKLKDSIEGSGVVLYGPFISSNTSGKKQVIISWNKIAINRGAFLNKLYGYKVGDRAYIGLIELLKGKKLGKSTIMIPVEHREEIFKLLKKYKVDAKILEVYI